MSRGLGDVYKRQVVLNAGRKIAEGRPQEVVLNREVIEAFLGEDQDVED